MILINDGIYGKHLKVYKNKLRMAPARAAVIKYGHNKKKMWAASITPTRGGAHVMFFL